MQDNENEIKLRSPIVQVILRKNPPFLVSWAMAILFVTIMLLLIASAFIKVNTVFVGSIHSVTLENSDSSIDKSMISGSFEKAIGRSLKPNEIVHINTSETPNSLIPVKIIKIESNRTLDSILVEFMYINKADGQLKSHYSEIQQVTLSAKETIFSKIRRSL